MVQTNDTKYMMLALELAERGRGRTSPNPMVGAAIVKDGEILGRGFHEQAGLPHAEAVALNQIQNGSRGATLYVNLEPCCCSGRTPPCTKAIIEAGIERVVCAVEDPNPHVSGQGIEELRQAGITVDVGLMAQEAGRLNEIYFKYIRTGLPFVSLKIAQTIDGKIAARDGSSRWISGEESRRFAHSLRSAHDAVLVGVNTVIADDPELTVRFAEGKNPIRIVLDSSLRTPLESKVFNIKDHVRTIVTTSDEADSLKLAGLRNKDVEVWILPTSAHKKVNLEALLKKSAAEGITSILVEGGSEVVTAFVGSRLADKIYICIAPTVLGSGYSSIQDLGIESLREAFSIRDTEVRLLGDDVLVTGYLD